MIRSRDVTISLASALVVALGVAYAETGGRSMPHSTVVNLADLQAVPTKTGEMRLVFDASTPTLSELDCHITTLNPGESPHLPHRHPDEEVLILKEGRLEVSQEDRKTIVEPGGVIFEASNELHTLRNIGTIPAVYYVVKFTPHDVVKASTPN